jgi:hypothetical protein
MNQHGVAVGRGFRDGIGADGAARAGPVLDHDGLAKLSADLVHHDARDDIAGAAGAERHDGGDVSRRPVLRRRRHEAGSQSAGRTQGGESDPANGQEIHGISPSLSADNRPASMALDDHVRGEASTRFAAGLGSAAYRRHFKN